MGGCWERLIRSVRAVFSGLTPQLHSFSTLSLCSLLYECRAIINSRPLTVIGGEQTPLCPNNLLFMKPAGTVLASLSNSTSNQYDSHLKSFISYCKENKVGDHFNITVKLGVEYLTSLFKANKSYSTIHSARSALSHFVCVKSDHKDDFGKHPLTS